jgi:2-polyprenyl-3-methyl-5-hydroxy-6-metoxy-1,4-benzoquinol methylase
VLIEKTSTNLHQAGSYYEEIYDPSFFGGELHTTRVGGSSVITRLRSHVDWLTWSARDISPAQAEHFYLSAVDSAEWSEDTRSLLALLRAEDAFRRSNFHTLRQAVDSLAKYGKREAVVKANKLLRAAEAITLLSPKSEAQSPFSGLEQIVDSAVEFVRQRTAPGDYGPYLQSLVRVETPVRLDFYRCGIDLTKPEEVLEFYRTTYSYILELTAANHQVETLNNYQRCLDILTSRGKKKLYDHGGGIGTLALLAHARGLTEVTIGELRGPTFDFARERARNVSADIKFVELDGLNIEIPSNPDVIACTEVLEHVFDPEALLSKFASALPDDGLLIVSESYDYIEDFCTHLPLHRGKGGAVFIEYMRSLDFAPVAPEEALHCQVFERC